MADKRLILGVDIGGTHMRLGLVDEGYRVSGFSITSTYRERESRRFMQALIRQIQAFGERELGGFRPAAVSLGFPSTIDRTRRTVLSTPNILALQNVPVVEALEQALDVPVFINRDVNFLFLCDVYQQQIDETGILLGCYVGTGLGNAISIDGKLLLGKNGVAAELGHIPVLGSDRPCGCGNRGCVENLASGRYLAELAAAFFPQTPIDQVFVEHGGHEKLEQYIDYLSLPIATEINLLDPDGIILGGGVMQMAGFPRAALEARIHAHTRKPLPADNLKIIYSRPAQENGVVGAGIYGFRRLARSDYR